MVLFLLQLETVGGRGEKESDLVLRGAGGDETAQSQDLIKHRAQKSSEAPLRSPALADSNANMWDLPSLPDTQISAHPSEALIARGHEKANLVWGHVSGPLLVFHEDCL